MTRFKKIKPEKRIEQDVRWWLARNSFWSEVFDSKGTYSEGKGRYAKSIGLPVGTPDLLAWHKSGVGAMIELKAPGKLESLSLQQYQFLMRGIEQNAFAVVVDSTERLETLWKEWNSLRSKDGLQMASKFLMEQLPKRISHGGRLIPAPRS